MTTIYIVPDLAKSTCQYICDSQQTIDEAPIYIKPLCFVGNEADANTKLTTNQYDWLNQQASIFTVNLQTTVEGGVVWTLIDLNTEPENTDRQYFVYDPTDGLHEPATGLDAAKTLFAQIQQEYLVFTNMDKYNTQTSWPPKPIPPV